MHAAVANLMQLFQEFVQGSLTGVSKRIKQQPKVVLIEMSSFRGVLAVSFYFVFGAIL